MIGIAVASTITVFVQANRDPFLSELAGTDPNTINWNAEFVEKLLWFGALPVLSLVAAQFPEVGRAVVGLLEPIMRVVH